MKCLHLLLCCWSVSTFARPSTLCYPTTASISRWSGRQNRHSSRNARSDSWSRLRGGTLPAGCADLVSVRQETKPNDDIFSSISQFSKDVWHQRIAPVLHDPDTHIVRPLKTFFLEPADGSNQFHSTRSHQSRGDSSLPNLACSILFRPNRVVRLVLMACLLTEGVSIARAVSRHPRVQARFHRAYQVTKPHLDSLREVATQWWKEQQNSIPDWRRLHTWAPKYHWAMGLAVGMIVSPAIMAWTVSALYVSGVLYGLAEVNTYGKLHSSFWSDQLSQARTRCNLDEQTITQSLWIHLDSALDAWRTTVRANLQHPSKIVSSVQKQVNILLGNSVDRKRDDQEINVDDFVYFDDNELFYDPFSCQYQVFPARHQLPINLQRGLIVGVVIGLLSGA